jgi:protein-L-isoaspartate(D-aspartate) O-methyltransferase
MDEERDRTDAEELEALERRYAEARERMVELQLRARGIRDEAVLKAMASVPRHAFVPEWIRGHAYADMALPIGRGSTISQPYVVAQMTELACLDEGSRVLEIGTGSGYQSAILAAVGAEVISLEIDWVLGTAAKKRLAKLGYARVRVEIGDGYLGWPAGAPYDAIVLTAAPRELPPPLREQVAVGGRIVAPVGPFGIQELIVITRTSTHGYETESIAGVAFVPMTGRADGEEDS